MSKEKTDNKIIPVSRDSKSIPASRREPGVSEGTKREIGRTDTLTVSSRVPPPPPPKSDGDKK
jgi:hypothetical protein